MKQKCERSACLPENTGKKGFTGIVKYDKIYGLSLGGNIHSVFRPWARGGDDSENDFSAGNDRRQMNAVPTRASNRMECFSDHDSSA